MTDVFDALLAETPQTLAAQGTLKWTKYPDAIAAWVAESDLGTAPAVRRALSAAVETGLLTYPPDATVAALSMATSEFLAERFGWSVDPADIAPLPDALKGLELGIHSFSPVGTPVIVPTPAYMPFLSVPGILGREVIEVPSLRTESGWHMDPQAIEDAFARGGRLLVLCNPHNPTGQMFSRDELVQISHIVDRFGGTVFADEIHAPILYDGGTHIPYASVSVEAASHSFTVVSASKGWNLPGIKCAQIIIQSPRLRALWEPVSVINSHGASTLGMIGNIAAYSAGQSWLDHAVDYLATNRTIVTTQFASTSAQGDCAVPRATYLAWIDFASLGLTEPPADFFLREAGVAMVDGARCGAGFESFARFNFALPRPILTRAMAQMVAATDRLGVH